MNPICEAAKEGQNETVAQLIRQQANIDAVNKVSLQNEIRQHPIQQLSLFCQDGETPLMLAVDNGHMKIVRVLLDANADADFRNKVQMSQSSESSIHDR